MLEGLKGNEVKKDLESEDSGDGEGITKTENSAS